MSSRPGEGTKTQLEYRPTYYAQYMYTCMQVHCGCAVTFKMTRTLNLILHISFKNELAMEDGRKENHKSRLDSI